MNARRRVFQGILVGLVAWGIVLALDGLGGFRALERLSWNWRASALARPATGTDEIRLIFLDQASLDWAHEENGLSWPWPREIYGAVADFCRRSGARALAFDVLFTEPSVYGVADDEAFGAALKNFGSAVGAAFLGQRAGSVQRWPEGVPTPGLTVQEAPGLPVFSRALLPIPEVTRGVALLANVHLTPDADGVYRRVTPLAVFDGEVLPAVGLGVYLAAHPGVDLGLETGALRVGPARVPLDRHGAAILRYRGPSGTHRAYSAAAVLQSELRMREGGEPVVDPGDLREKYVLFGFSAPGLYDLRPTPVGGLYPGVEIQATLLDDLLSNDFLRDPPAGTGPALALGLALAVGLLASLLSTPAGTLSTGGVLAVAPVALALFAYGKGLWLPMAAPLAAALGATALGLAANYAAEGRQKRFLKTAFRQYLSPEVIEELIARPERLKLGGERRTLSIFFSDLEGFTSLSEGLEPEALTALLNDYLSAMTDIIHEQGGTVDKYEGDAIIAFWNAPLELPDHALRAVRAALRCQETLAELRPAFRERVGKDLHMRVGVNTGPAVVGNMGSHTRFDYTMLGDAVNLAARLEGANKEFGTYTMIAEATRDAVGDAFPMRELARLVVVGRREPVRVYEPFTARDAEARGEILARFAAGLDFFYRGCFAEAAEIFASIREDDAPARVYFAKSQALAGSTPPDWDGTWWMTSKG